MYTYVYTYEHIYNIYGYICIHISMYIIHMYIVKLKYKYDTSSFSHLFIPDSNNGKPDNPNSRNVINKGLSIVKYP